MHPRAICFPQLICTGLTVFIGLRRMGRVTALTAGGISVGVVFFVSRSDHSPFNVSPCQLLIWHIHYTHGQIFAAISATHPSDPRATSPSSASIALVFLMYLWVYVCLPYQVTSHYPRTDLCPVCRVL